MGVPATDPLAQLSLPPGFRFFPTDEELMVQYLCPKVAGHHFSLQIIGEIDLYKFDPWDLPSKAIFGEKEWYFFSPRDRKYPNGSRPNRVAGSGYWKATGTDKVITTEGRKVGIKKALVFYVGKAPKGTKTNWIMHEYRLSDTTRKSGSLKLDEWVLCRIYKKNSGGQKPDLSDPKKEVSHGGSSSSSSSQFDDMLESLPEIKDRFFNLPRMKSLEALHKENKLNIQSLTSGNFDWASIAGAATLPELVHPPGHQLNNNNNNNNNNLNMSLINDGYAPSAEEEVQSGLRKQRVLNAGYFQQNLTGLSRSNDPFGIRYPTQTGGSGFGFHQ